MRVLATQRLVALALVESDGRQVTVSPLPVDWSVIRAIVGALALWWMVRRGVFAAMDRAAGWLTCLPARLQMTIIVIWMVAYEIGSQTINTGRA